VRRKRTSHDQQLDETLVPILGSNNERRVLVQIRQVDWAAAVQQRHQLRLLVPAGVAVDLLELGVVDLYEGQ